MRQKLNYASKAAVCKTLLILDVHKINTVHSTVFSYLLAEVEGEQLEIVAVAGEVLDACVGYSRALVQP